MEQGLASNKTELNDRFTDALDGLQYLNGKQLTHADTAYDWDFALTDFSNSKTAEARRARQKLAQVEAWLATYSKMAEPEGFLFRPARAERLRQEKGATIRSWTRPIAAKDPRFANFLEYRCKNSGRDNACRALELIREAEEFLDKRRHPE